MIADTSMQRSHIALALLPLLLCTAVPPTAAQAPPVGDILSQVVIFLNIQYMCIYMFAPVSLCTMVYRSNLKRWNQICHVSFALFSVLVILWVLHD